MQGGNSIQWIPWDHSMMLNDTYKHHLTAVIHRSMCLFKNHSVWLSYTWINTKNRSRLTFAARLCESLVDWDSIQYVYVILSVW